MTLAGLVTESDSWLWSALVHTHTEHTHTFWHLHQQRELNFQCSSVLFFIFSYSILSFFPFGPSLLHSVLFSYYISSFHLSISPPPHPRCHSNRKAAPRWKGRTPRGPPLSSCSEGRRRRRKELREYVRIKTLSPSTAHSCHLWTLQFYPPAHRRSCGAAWECCATGFWHHTMRCYCVTLHVGHRFCWVTAS